MANWKQFKAAAALVGVRVVVSEARGWVELHWEPSTFLPMLELAKAYKLFDTYTGFENHSASTSTGWIPVPFDRFSD